MSEFGYKYDPKYCQTAIDLLSQGKSIVAVAAACNVTRDTVYDWLDRYPQFGEAVKLGMSKSQAWWEDEGVKGMKGEYEKFSANIWMFTVKNRFRKDYAEDKKDDNSSAAASFLENLASGKITITKND